MDPFDPFNATATELCAQGYHCWHERPCGTCDNCLHHLGDGKPCTNEAGRFVECCRCHERPANLAEILPAFGPCADRGEE